MDPRPDPGPVVRLSEAACARALGLALGPWAVPGPGYWNCAQVRGPAPGTGPSFNLGIGD